MRYHGKCSFVRVLGVVPVVAVVVTVLAVVGEGLRSGSTPVDENVHDGNLLINWWLILAITTGLNDV